MLTFLDLKNSLSYHYSYSKTKGDYRMSYLELKDIRKSYYLGKEEFPVLKGINLKFELGEFVSILGESGGGKSTLMNIIGGLDRKFEGEVQVKGELLDHHKEKEMDEYRRGTIGYIYQSYNLISHLTVLDNVLTSLEMAQLTQAQRVERAKEMLIKVGLEDQIKKHPNQLSGGQKQRVAIARALAADPEIIIADEPTGALDAVNTEEVLEILRNIAAEGKLVIAVTHSQDVADFGTRIVHLEDGKVDYDKIVREKYPEVKNESKIVSRKLPASASYSNAWKHLKYNFGRNSLIMIGTAIGLFAVLLFSGLGNGIKGYINDQVDSLVNPNAMMVQRYTKTSGTASSQSEAGAQSASADPTTTSFSQAQIKKMADVKHVDSVESMFVAANMKFSMSGRDYTLATVQSWTKFFSKDMLKAGTLPGKDEIVVDKKTVAKVYDSKDWKSVVGKKIDVKWTTTDDSGNPVQISKKLTISGVVDAGQSGASMNAMSSATMKSVLKDAGATTKPSATIVNVDNSKDVESVSKKIDSIKMDNQRVFKATTIGSTLKTVNTIVDLATYVLMAIAGISLVVSALMIIVSMYMSVSERTKEIGILRALGESKADVRRLFTSESLLIGLISAALATVLAFGLGYLLNQFLYSIAKYDLIQISLGNIVMTFILAIVISFLAALLPARSAAKLNPIDALAAD